MARAHIGVALGQLDVDLRVEAANQHGFANACGAGQRKEFWQGFAVGIQPVGCGIRLGRHVANVIACCKNQSVKTRQIILRDGTRYVIHGDKGQLRHGRGGWCGLACGNGDLMTLRLQVQCGVTAEKACASDNKNFHGESVKKVEVIRNGRAGQAWPDRCWRRR